MNKVITPGDGDLPHASLRDGRKSDALNLLLSDPSGLNKFDQFHQTPLHIAADKGFDDMVALFLQRGAKVNAMDNNKWTPLHNACDNGHFMVVKLLLENGANPTLLTTEGASALHYIVRHQWKKHELCEEVMKLFVEKGADVNAQNHHMETPLHGAGFKGIGESIKFLIEHGADVNLPNSKGETCLHFVARTSRVDIAQLLVSCGADITKRGDNGTCIDVAGTPEMAKLFEDKLASTGISLPATRTETATSFLNTAQKSLLIGPMKLLPRQRRLRHIKRIVARSIYDLDPHDRGLLDTYFTMHEEEDSEPFYTSNVVIASLNPNWRSLPSRFSGLRVSSKNCVVFVIKVWDCHLRNGLNGNGHHLLFHSVIDLNRLGYIGTSLKELGAFPPNTLVFESLDGLYLNEKVISAMMRSPHYSPQRPPVSTKTSLSCTYTSFSTFIERTQQLKALQVENEIAQQKLEERRQNLKELRLLECKREMLKDRIQRIQAEYAKRVEAITIAREKLDNEKLGTVPRRAHLDEKQKNLEQNRQRLGRGQRVLERERKELATLNAVLKWRQAQLIKDIEHIYFIGQQPSSKWFSIASLPLPDLVSNFSDVDEEELATALGCVSHAVLLISDYLQIPLRYPIKFKSSRSIIYDRISTDDNSSLAYSLYGKNPDTAVYLLHKNISQLLCARGLKSAKPKTLLGNLYILLTGKNDALPRVRRIPTISNTSPSNTAVPGNPAASSLASRLSPSPTSPPNKIDIPKTQARDSPALLGMSPMSFSSSTIPSPALPTSPVAAPRSFGTTPTSTNSPSGSLPFMLMGSTPIASLSSSPLGTSWIKNNPRAKVGVKSFHSSIERKHGRREEMPRSSLANSESFDSLRDEGLAQKTEQKEKDGESMDSFIIHNYTKKTTPINIGSGPITTRRSNVHNNNGDNANNTNSREKAKPPAKTLKRLSLSIMSGNTQDATHLSKEETLAQNH